MKLVVLVENHTLDPKLKPEHGLSIYVEKDGFRMVFDMGETGLFMENALELGVDLNNLDAIAFSHNHRDHCGGFISFVNKGYKPATMYVHNGYFRRKWWDHTKDPLDAATYDRSLEFVGPVMSPDFLYQNGYRQFRMIQNDIYELAPDIYLVGNFSIDYEKEPPHCSQIYEVDPVTFAPDDFRDEQVCVIRTPKGLVILPGCAHCGIMSIVTTIEKRFPGEKIYAIFGGTHLIQSEEWCIDRTIEYINSIDLGIAGVCHCTGTAAMAKFEELTSSYVDVGVGYIWSDDE